MGWKTNTAIGTAVALAIGGAYWAGTRSDNDNTYEAIDQTCVDFGDYGEVCGLATGKSEDKGTKVFYRQVRAADGSIDQEECTLRGTPGKGNFEFTCRSACDRTSVEDSEFEDLSDSVREE